MRTKTTTELVTGFVTAVQGAAAGFVDFSIGSIELAWAESTAQVGLWLQGLILALLAATRASTSTGADLDSWMADFGVTRLGALKATGNVTFSRRSSTVAVSIPSGTFGATVASFDGGQTFIVQTDTGNSAWNSGLGVYQLGIGVTSITIPVKAQKAGAAGNAAIGTVTLITSTIVGVDAVTNASRFSGGADVETDEALRARFQLYINSLSRGTRAAVQDAVVNTSGVTTYSITENLNTGGSSAPGYFYVVIDDGSGNPANSLVTAVTNAVAAVVPITTTFSVIKPTLVSLTVAFKIAAGPGFTNAAMQTKAAAAVTAYLNTLGVGVSLSYSKLIQVAYEASPGIANVFNLTINSGTSDITATAKQVLRPGSVTVTH